MKLKPLTDSTIYKQFKKNRDRALEKVLHVHLVAIDLIISKLERKVVTLAMNRHARDQFRVYGAGPIDRELHLASMQVSTLFVRLRASAYLLAHGSELEAISRAMGEPQKGFAKVKAHILKDTPSGGSVLQRITLSFDRLGRKIQDALQLSQVLEEDPTDRIMKAFPKTRELTHTPALSKRRLKEADDDLGVSQLKNIPKMSVGITDEDLWEEILNDYKADILPSDIFQRGPNDKTLFYDIDEEGMKSDMYYRYTWEVEKEITEDFVRSVREGTNEAAAENGIKDFQWIAVLDGHTDECCESRDGYTSSQIEEMIASGKIDGEECDAIVAPAHFNCRCDSVPMTEDIPDKVPFDFGSFDDWLEEKAKE